MLENGELLLLPWDRARRAICEGQVPAFGDNLVRPICDPRSNAFLGFVAPRVPVVEGWLPWLSRQAFDIYETEDASLLLTLYGPRLLSSTWEVRDSEERRVGLIYRQALMDHQGMQFGVARSSPSRRAGSFVSRHGTELAGFAIDGGALLLHFHEPVAGLPFVRMILLAAALTVAEEHSDLRLRRVG